jgi:hypothetical protein
VRGVYLRPLEARKRRKHLLICMHAHVHARTCRYRSVHTCTCIPPFIRSPWPLHECMAMERLLNILSNVDARSARSLSLPKRLPPQYAQAGLTDWFNSYVRNAIFSDSPSAKEYRRAFDRTSSTNCARAITLTRTYMIAYADNLH